MKDTIKFKINCLFIFRIDKENVIKAEKREIEKIL